MRSDERGLALLLVVSLMALVTLIVVSLAVITRIETSVGQARAEQRLARENALVGLRTALGRLQLAAGPDRRVTATAEATGNTLNPHWVGVWRTDIAGNQPETWLVSGESPDPRNQVPFNREVELVIGDETEAMNVVAPLELLDAPNTANSVRGGFAYFIADQGLKAQLAPALDSPAADDYYGQRRLLMGGSRPQGFGDIIEIDPSNPELQDGLELLKYYDQLSAISPEDADSIVARWHDYSGWSRGLLVNTAAGGIKTDLSIAGDAAIPGISAYTNLMTPDRQSQLSPAYPMQAATPSEGEIYDGIHPLVTQIGIQFSVHTISSSSRTLETRLRFFVELNNPYTVALEAEDLRLVVSGLPQEIQIESRTVGSDSDHGSATVNLEALYALHTDDSERPAIEFDLPFEAQRWEPGRTINWRLPSGNTMGEAANRELVFEGSTRTSFWRERPGEVLDGPDALVNSSELRFTGSDDWEIRYSLQQDDGQELTSGVLPVFFRVETAWQDANSTLPDFGIEARIADRNELQAAGGDSSWLVDLLDSDGWRRQMNEELWLPKIDLDSASYNVSFSSPISGVEARQLFNRDPVDRSSLSYYQPGYNSDVGLFELPRQPWLSVGSLQHLSFTTGPVYNVGNSWSERNDWFDAYFFSGRISGALDSDDVTTPVLELVQPTGEINDTRSGQYWWIASPFNINSVRSAAWMAVLQGLGTGLADFALSYTTHEAETGRVSGQGVETLIGPMARFPQSAGETWEISSNPTNFQAVLRTYRRGARSLTKMQMQGVADLLTEFIQNRISEVGPYRSIEEFLAADPARFANRNVIEHAIAVYDEDAAVGDRINWDHYFPEAPIPIDQAAPSFLTSADFMTPLAPQLATRSDTFVIRAYGESMPETTRDVYGSIEPTGRGWVEALVQRFPEGVDPSDYVQADESDWRNPVSDETFGRRFRVIALRWLQEEDL